MIVNSRKQYSGLEEFNVTIAIRNEEKEPIAENSHLVIASNILSSNSWNVLKNLTDSLLNNGFLFLEETSQIDVNSANLLNQNMIHIATQTVAGSSYHLFRKKEHRSAPIVIQITEKNFMWLEGVKAALKKVVSENQELLLVSQGEELLGKYYPIFLSGYNTFINFNNHNMYRYDWIHELYSFGRWWCESKLCFHSRQKFT